MDMTKRNIIFLENGRASVIRHYGQKIEFIKRDGEIDFPITVDFWDWWKKAVSFIDDDDDADFCFIYDKQYDLLNDTFLLGLKLVDSQDSVWDIKYIKSFFWELKPTYFSVVLFGKAKQEYVLGDNNYDVSMQKRFYTNLNVSNFKHGKKVEINQDVVDEPTISDEDVSPIAKYFIDLIRKERGYQD